MATMLRVCGMLLQQVLASRVVRSGIASHLIDFILLLSTLIADGVKINTASMWLWLDS